MTIAETADPDDVVQTLYLSLLGRAADPAGLDFLTQLVNFEDPAAVAALGDILIASSEFQNSFAAGSSENFVRSVYFNLFDRNADTDEVEAWTDRLDAQGLAGPICPRRSWKPPGNPTWKPTRRSSSSPTTSRIRPSAAATCPTR